MNTSPLSLRSCALARSVLQRLLVPLLALVLPSVALADFGLTTTDEFYTVDTGAGLVFKVRRVDAGSNTQSPGDIASLVYNGVEYQDLSRGSQINSGFDWLYSTTSASAVAAETIGTDYIKITVTAGDLTHYYVAKRGSTNVYMGTYFASEPDVHGLVRYIVRMPSELVPDGPVPSDIRNNTGAIESADIFGLANGETRSKHYSNHRQMDWKYTGATGPNVGVWMVKNNEEGMSGGPFYRCLINQTGGDQEVYAMINYGEIQTDVFRYSILNLYTLAFNDGSAPTVEDLAWMDSLNLLGWVPASGRGAVTGSTSGVPSSFQTVVGLSNATAQYWGTATSGSYSIAGVIPGTYTATLFKGELAVATGSVTVSAGGTSTLNLASTETVDSAIFRIGDWDGAPTGFLNADKITTMHPTDVRMDSWATTTYTVGTDSPASFPSIQARAANSPYLIKFNLAPNQITALTLKIGITVAYNGGRPQVTVNNSYTTPVINASSQPATRSITVGSYRGNNTTFTFSIPASALVVGTNTLSITPISGSADLGTWLSASWVYDAVELDGPIATPTITYVGGSPLVISGTAEAGRTVTVTLDGSTVLGTTTAAAGGTWSFVYGGTLSVGSHSLTAVADDGAGHSSPTSAAFNFSSGVTMPTIVSAIGDTGTYSSGATTSDRVFVFSGTATAGDTVTLTRIGVGTIGSVVAGAGGTWTFNYTDTSLPDGVNAFYATSANASGSSVSSPVFTLTLSGAPRVAIARYNPATSVIGTGVSTVVFRVTFNHPVTNVTTAAFGLTTTGSASGSITGVAAASASIYDVTVDGLAGTGTLRLDLKAGIVVDTTTSSTEGAFTAGQAYSLVLPTTGSGVWTNATTGGLWSDANNWQNAVIADGAANSGNFATLDLTSDNTVHLDSGRTLNSLTFADTGSATAASWTVDNNGSSTNLLTLAGTSPSITVGTLGTGAITTVNAGLAGTAGLTKAGAGTLVLSGQSPLTGVLTLSGGTLRVAPGASLALGNSAINAVTNAVLNVTGGSLSAGGLASIATSLTIDGGTVNLGSFRTNATFGTLFKVTGGAVTVGDINLQRTAGTAVDYTTGLIITGGSLTATTLRVGTSNSYANVSVEGTGTLTVTGTTTLGVQTTDNRGGALRVIGGTFTSTDTAYGVLLCRTNTSTKNAGTATFTAGVSTVEKFTLGYDATVTGTANINVNGGAVYIGSGGIVKNGAATMTTNLTFSSGIVGAKAPWSTAVPITLPASGNITFQTADAGAVPYDITLAGAISGAGGFTKTGAGTLTLDGTGVTHTFTGAANVNAGVLRVTSALGAATNAIAINSGGALTGNGTISRPITLNAGGTLAPDGATAAATLSGTSLTWNAGGTLAFNLGGATDQLALTGALTKAGTGSYAFQFTPDASLAPGTYTLVTFASTDFAASDFSATGLPTGLAGQFVLAANALNLVVYGPPVVTSGSAAGIFGAPFSYAIAATDSPTTYSATGLPAGLTLDPGTGVISGAPGAVGTFAVALTATNAAGTGEGTLTVSIVPAAATVQLGNLNQVYDGAPKPVSATTTPAGLALAITYNGSATVPTNAGSYAVVATLADPHYVGSASGTLVISKAVASVVLGALQQTYDGTPKAATATTTPAGLSVVLTYDGGSTAPTNVGSYAVVATINDANYTGSASGTLVIAQGTATLVLQPLEQAYDGTPKPVTATTAPAGLTVTLTYNGSGTAPTLPGSYTVVATINDANYTGTTEQTLVITITALVRHAPSINGELEGSVQQLTGESVTLNGNSALSGDLLVPGVPTLQANGRPTYVGVQDAAGAATPTGYYVTLNGGSVLRYLVRRVNPIALPTVAAPATPTGTRYVTMNRATDPVGDFATLRDLTLNSNVGNVAVPPGTYGAITVNSSGSGLVLGVADSTTPTVYQLQQLTLNGGATVQVVGPVILRLAYGLTLNGTLGAVAHPSWVTLQIANGSVTLNSGAALRAIVVAPNGTVTINGNTVLTGRVSADRLTLNGNGVLVEP